MANELMTPFEAELLGADLSAVSSTLISELLAASEAAAEAAMRMPHVRPPPSCGFLQHEALPSRHSHTASIQDRHRNWLD